MLIDSSQSTLSLDVQDKLFSKIENHKEILAVIEKITLPFTMDLPIVYEQYPNGLGSTIKDLKENLEILNRLE